MTVIRPNSITGITSITALANEINVFRHNGVLAGLQLNGVNHHTSAGVSTFHTVNVLGNLDVAGVLTYQDVTNVDSLGIGTFRTGINVSGGQLDVGSNIKLGNAGVITATSFVGSVTGNVTGNISGGTVAGSTGTFTGDLSIAQDLVHTGDTDTKLSFYNDTISLNTAGIERFRIYNDGVVAIGQSSKSSTVGAGGLDIQGNGTNCIIEMGNPFPTFSGGVVPEFRITATNSGHEVKFESIWGGDNLLHPHIGFTGGRTHFYRGTNSDEIARFDANKFWIGTTSGHGQFQVHDGTIVHSKPAGGGTRNYRFVNNNTAAGDYGIQISTTEAGSSYVNHTELKAGGDVHIHDGNLKLASGHGIDFSATGQGGGSSTMSNELLNDYEVGTWVPVANGFTASATYHANYTKIGRLVHITMWVQTASGSSGNPFYISGLPYTVRGGQNCYQYACGRLGSGSYTNSQSDIVFEFTPNNTTIFPKVQDGGMNWGMASNTHVMITGSYITD